MATGWVLNKVSEAIAPTVSNTVATAGGFAGDIVCGVGNSINGVGQSINDAIRRYGNGAMEAGNGLKDWTNAPGLRAGTAANPLGLSNTTAGGRRAITSLGTAKPSSTWTPAAPQKALPAPKSSVSVSKSATMVKSSSTSPKPRLSSINTAKPFAASTAGRTPAIGSARSVVSSTASRISPYKPPATLRKTGSNTSKKVTYSARPKVTASTAEARNPLGI
jgi:hypothetical protein